MSLTTLPTPITFDPSPGLSAPVLRRDQALQLLAMHRDRLRTAYRIKSLALFGSVARDEARPDSDVDLLVEFETLVGLRGFMDCRFELEAILGRPVDLVMRSAVKPSRRAAVEAEALRVWPCEVASAIRKFMVGSGGG